MQKLNFLMKILMIPIDALAVMLALITSYWIRSDGGNIFQWPYDDYLVLVYNVFIIWLIAFAFMGLYTGRNRQSLFEQGSKIIFGSLTGWAIFIAILYFVRTDQTQTLPRLIPLYSFILIPIYVFIGHIFIRFVEILNYLSGNGLQKVLIVGNDSSFAKDLAKKLALSTKSGYQYLATISGDLNKIISQIKKYKPNEVWVTKSSIIQENNQQLVDYCEMRSIVIKVAPDIYDIRNFNVQIFPFQNIVFMEFQKSPLEGWGSLWKRLMDIILSVIVLIILLPVTIIVIIGVKLSSRGPIFYCQKRMSQDAKEFKIYKFRSMYIENERNVKHDWSVKDESSDSRITPFGRFIRKTNLDEIPQIYNVLIGDMSWVGPRPEQPNYVEKFSKDIPDYLKRHYVKSGITGWAQVNGLRGDTSISERIKYDLFYIQHWSIFFDLKILLQTVKMFFSKEF